jgi:hypothetical protein
MKLNEIEEINTYIEELVGAPVHERPCWFCRQRRPNVGIRIEVRHGRKDANYGPRRTANRVRDIVTSCSLRGGICRQWATIPRWSQ